MGSASDWSTMHAAVEVLERFDVPHEAKVVSAHRMPDEMFAFAESARGRGIRAIIAGAGGAAHLPGMLAAKTTLPVLGVPVPSRHLQGQDSLLSIVQMPAGVPVATFAIGEAGATNAGAVRRSLCSPPMTSRCVDALDVERAGPPRAGVVRDPAATVHPVTPIVPPATIGVLGGGQLGRYTVVAARLMGYGTVVLDPDHAAPAGAVADIHLVAAVRRCGCPRPDGRGVRGRHHRVREPAGGGPGTPRQRRRRRPVAGRRRDRAGPGGREGVPARTRRAHGAVVDRRPRRLPGDRQDGPSRLRRQGPGRGRRRRRAARPPSNASPCHAWSSGGSPSTSSSACSSPAPRDGRHVTYPVAENAPRSRHPRRHRRAGPDRSGRSPPRPRRWRSASPRRSTTSACWPSSCSSADGRLLVNELAPRPHNSGHWTLDASATSQFEQQVRAVCGLALGPTELVGGTTAAMANLLGDRWAGRRRRRGSGRSPTRPPTSTSTASGRPGRVARWGT